MANDRRPLAPLLIVIAASQMMLVSSMHSGLGIIRRGSDSGTVRSVTDNGDYVTMDWEPHCAEILKWKDYKYLPREPRGYVVHIWGLFEPDNAHVFGTLKDAQQYVELNWCKP